jgi:hypothetical protein
MNILELLDSEAARHGRAAIVVHLGRTEYIHAHDPDRQMRIEAALALGAQPIGLMVTSKGDKEGLTSADVKYEPFGELFDINEADNYLQLLRGFEYAQEFAARKIPNDTKAGGKYWLLRALKLIEFPRRQE